MWGLSMRLARLIVWVLVVAIYSSVPSWSVAAQLQTARFQIKYTGVTEAQAKGIGVRAEAALDFVEAFFDRKQERRITIVIEDKRGIPRADNRRSRIIIPADRIRGDAGGPPRIRGRGPAIAHEITHLLAKSRGHPNRYLDEGLAVYVQELFGGRAYPNMGHDLHDPNGIAIGLAVRFR
jgi:hypothetical protein